MMTTERTEVNVWTESQGYMARPWVCTVKMTFSESMMCCYIPDIYLYCTIEMLLIPFFSHSVYFF